MKKKGKKKHLVPIWPKTTFLTRTFLVRESACFVSQLYPAHKTWARGKLAYLRAEIRKKKYPKPKNNHHHRCIKSRLSFKQLLPLWVGFFCEPQSLSFLYTMCSVKSIIMNVLLHSVHFPRLFSEKWYASVSTIYRQFLCSAFSLCCSAILLLSTCSIS